MEQKRKVLIIEDEPIISADLSNYMRKMDYLVVGRAFNSEKALDLIAIHLPDLILLDVNIEGTRDGIEIGQIIQDKYKIPFIYITSYSDSETLDRAKVTMPHGYIVKPFNERDITTTVEIAMFRVDNNKNKGFSYLDRSKIDKVCNTALTNKEFEVIEDIILGFTNKELAEKHFLSINTIKTHVKNLFSKLEVKNRAAAIAKVSQV